MRACIANQIAGMHEIESITNGTWRVGGWWLGMGLQPGREPDIYMIYNRQHLETAGEIEVWRCTQGSDVSMLIDVQIQPGTHQLRVGGRELGDGQMGCSQGGILMSIWYITEMRSRLRLLSPADHVIHLPSCVVWCAWAAQAQMRRPAAQMMGVWLGIRKC